MLGVGGAFLLFPGLVLVGLGAIVARMGGAFGPGPTFQGLTPPSARCTRAEKASPFASCFACHVVGNE